MNDLESQLHRLLESSANEPERVLTASDVRRFGRRQRLRFSAAIVVAGAVIVAAIAIPLTVSRNEDRAQLGTRPSSPPSSAPPTAQGSDPPAARAGGVVLGLDRNGRLVRAWPGTSRRPEPISARSLPGGPSMIATDPITGGWVVSFTPDVHAKAGDAGQRLAFVSPDGKVEPFGPVLAATESISGLAVNPSDGGIAIAIFHSSGGDTRPAEIRLLPGGSAQIRTWVADSADVNEIVDLSWNTAGTRLAYIAGSQTGAGVGGSPSFLNTRRPGRTAPTDSPWRRDNKCTPVAAAWLLHDRFAVIAECDGDTDTFQLVDPDTGQPSGSSLPLGEAGCMGAGLHPADNSGDVLIGWCDSLYLVHNNTATRLNDALKDAAWAGHNAPTQ